MHFRVVSCLSCCALLVFAIAPSRADLVGPPVVAPNVYASTEGDNSNTLPFYPSGAPMRYQQVFAASQFGASAAGGGAQAIARLGLRRDATQQPFASNFPMIDIRLSTTSKQPDALSMTFANNIGADEVQVYSGPLNWSSSAVMSTPQPFDLFINLQTPFTYNPANGNLLMEIRAPASETFAALDAAFVNGDAVSRILNDDSDNSPTANYFDTLGLVVQFATPSQVPEPIVGAPLLAGIALLCRRAGRKRTSRRGDA